MRRVGARAGDSPAEKMDRFAELLAEGLEVQEAGNRLGYSRGGSQGMMRRLREKMGWQAQ